jgi:hypothetical protein
MSRWKRVVLSLASALGAQLIVGFVQCARGTRGALLEGLIVFMWFGAFLVIPGWIIALPIVLSFKRIDGWRIWIQALLGCLIGPLIMGLIGLFSVLTRPPTTTWAPGTISFVYLAAAISILATAIYLTTVKLSVRTAQTPSS